MDRAFWLERWKKGQIGFHQQDVNPALPAHWADLRVPQGATVFVPLCGKSLDMLWLRAQGHAILGVELSPIAVREFFAEHGLEARVSTQDKFERWEAEGIALLCGDVFDLTRADLEDVDGVYDRASLVALPKTLRELYVEKLIQALPAGVPTLLVTLSYPEGEISGPPFSVPEAEVRRLYAGRRDIRLLSSADATPQLRDRGSTQVAEHVFAIR